METLGAYTHGANLENNKICIIGNGVHSKANIIPSIIELGAEITAIASTYFEEETKEVNGTVLYKDYKEMIEKEKPSKIIIVTKAENQFEITRYCIEKKIAKIFVEKPMGMNCKEAEELDILADKNNCKLFVGFMKQYSPCYKLMKEITNRDNFGKIKHFSSEFYITSGRKGWNDEIFLKKGGIHFCNLLLWYFGEVEEVKSFTSTTDENVSLTAIIKFKSGIVGSINFIGLSAWKGKRETITVTGENGYVYNNEVNEVYYHIDKPVEAQTRWKTLDEEEIKVKAYETSASGGLKALYLKGYVDELDCFINTEFESNSKQNIETMKLIDRILG